MIAKDCYLLYFYIFIHSVYYIPQITPCVQLCTVRVQESIKQLSFVLRSSSGLSPYTVALEKLVHLGSLVSWKSRIHGQKEYNRSATKKAQTVLNTKRSTGGIRSPSTINELWFVW